MSEQASLFSPIKSKRSFEKVSADIKSLIFDGTLRPGDRLPSETELANQFSVSRQTIREALRILELSGFITVQKGGSGGPLIKDTIMNTIGDLFLDAFRMEKISIDEITQARLEIEKVVLNHVMDYADEASLDKLHKNIVEADKKIKDNMLATDCNIEFHRLLAEASKNHLFVIVIGSILAVLRDLLTRLNINSKTSDGTRDYQESILNSKEAVKAHRQIVDAIVKKDRDKAISLLESHLVELKERLQAFVY